MTNRRVLLEIKWIFSLNLVCFILLHCSLSQWNSWLGSVWFTLRRPLNKWERCVIITSHRLTRNTSFRISLLLLLFGRFSLSLSASLSLSLSHTLARTHARTHTYTTHTHTHPCARAHAHNGHTLHPHTQTHTHVFISSINSNNKAKNKTKKQTNKQTKKARRIPRVSIEEIKIYSFLRIFTEKEREKSHCIKSISWSYGRMTYTFTEAHSLACCRPVYFYVQ